MQNTDEIDSAICAIWAAEHWGRLEGYETARIRSLADRARERRDPVLAASLDGFADCVILPWIGSAFGTVGPRVGVYLREYPLPARVDRHAILPISAGLEPLTGEVHRQEVDAIRSGRCSGYFTLQTAIDAAAQVCQRLGLGLPRDRAAFLDHVVVGDWVKLFALFCNRRGDMHDIASPSRRSCHTSPMYRFAAHAFAEEIALFEFDHVIVFGRTDVALIERMACKAPRYILPHPQAWGGGLRHAVTAFGGRDMPPPAEAEGTPDGEEHEPANAAPSAASVLTPIVEGLQQALTDPFGDPDQRWRRSTYNGRNYYYQFAPVDWGRERGCLHYEIICRRDAIALEIHRQERPGSEALPRDLAFLAEPVSAAGFDPELRERRGAPGEPAQVLHACSFALDAEPDDVIAAVHRLVTATAARVREMGAR